MASSDVLSRVLSDGNCKQKLYYGTGRKGRDFNQSSAEYEAVTENKQITGCDAMCLYSDTRLSES
jgi:hypothetical protein